MRCLLLLALFSLALASVSAATPNTPSNLGPTQDECLLDSLTMENMNLNPPFQSNWFHYECDCNFQPGQTFTTVAHPHTKDSGSSVEVSFTSNGFTTYPNTKANGDAISNGGPNGQAPNSPWFESRPLTFNTGDNTIVLGVSCNGMGEPPCYYEYTIHCYKPPTQGGSVVGDPQFVGLRGQNYQVHGVSGEIYNIVSDKDLQYNSRFVFLSEGKCPVVDGKKQKGCFSHPGSYLGELGLKTRSGDRIHVTSGEADNGFAVVEVNGKPLQVGDSIILADNMGSVSLNNTHVASVTIGNWDFVFENSDLYINQKVRVLDSRGLRAHGLLGQTWRETTYPNAIKYIQGQVDDYVIREGEIFGDNFVFNNHN